MCKIKRLRCVWLHWVAVDLAGSAKRKQGSLAMEQSEVPTEKETIDNKMSSENQANEVTDQVVSQVSNPGADCKSSEDTESRYDRLKLFDKVMQKTLDKFVDLASFNRFASTFRPLYKKNPQMMESIHKQFIEDLRRTIQEDINRLIEEGRLDFKLNELDKLEQAAKSKPNPAWRPSGVPEQDFCSFLMPYYQKQEAYMRQELKKIQAENAALVEKVQAGRESIAQTDQHISTVVEEWKATVMEFEKMASSFCPSLCPPDVFDVSEEPSSRYSEGLTERSVPRKQADIGRNRLFPLHINVLFEIDMTEMFSTLFGQNDVQGPPGTSSLGFGPGKPPPPLPQNQVSMTGQMPPQLGDEGPALRKPGAMNEPFYLLRELPVGNELTGNTNLITHYNLEHAYNKFCGKKVKEKLSNFLPELPGMIDCPGTQDGSSLRSLIDKPPVCGNSFSPLTGALLTGFRLHTGPLPEQYRLMHIQPPKKKSKHKHKHHRPQDPLPQETPSDSDPKKKKKKRDDDPDRKKKKKDKKKKKNRHSPDHPGLAGSQPNSNSLR
ncbi:uncharacterized protein V6R79_009574 [Siganus canaliculatus]